MQKFSAGMGVGAADLPVGPLTKGLKAVFMKAYNEAWDTSILNKIATKVDSNSDSEDYPWLGAVPKVREFIGPRQLHDLANFNYNLRNKKWENSIGVQREDLEDNKFGQIKMRVQQLGQEAARYPEELAIGLLQLAMLNPTVAAYAGYDGKGFFATDHPAPREIGGAVQDNLDGNALTYANLWAAIYKMACYKDDVGRFLGVRPSVLMVGTYLEDLAIDLCKSTFNVDTASSNTPMKENALRSVKLEVVATPLLDTNATAATCNWCLLDTSGVVKPLIFQERVPVQFGSLTKESEHGFMQGEFVYGTYARWNVGFGPWFRAYASAP